MQLVNTILFVTAALTLVSCAEQKRFPLAILRGSKHPDTTLELRFYKEKQRFTIKGDLRDANPHARIEVESPQVLSIERREDVMIFQSRRQKSTKVMDVISSTFPPWVPSKEYDIPPLVLNQNGEYLPKTNIFVEDGDIIIVLLPMSKETGENCRIEKMITAYIKSKKESDGDKIDKAIRKFCKDNTVGSAVLRFRQ